MVAMIKRCVFGLLRLCNSIFGKTADVSEEWLREQGRKDDRGGWDGPPWRTPKKVAQSIDTLLMYSVMAKRATRNGLHYRRTGNGFDSVR